MYLANGSLIWHGNQRVSIDLFGNYDTTATSFNCEYKGGLVSTVEEIPSLSASFKHDYNSTKVVTDVHAMVSTEHCQGTFHAQRHKIID